MIIAKSKLGQCSMNELRALAYTYTNMSIFVLYRFKRQELVSFLKERNIEDLLTRRKK
jgi:hypothetical protein